MKKKESVADKVFGDLEKLGNSLPDALEKAAEFFNPIVGGDKAPDEKEEEDGNG